jgi:hypothetical protein
MAHLKPWYQRHMFPAVDELYHEDEAAARRHLAAAWTAWKDDPQLTADERRALEYELVLFEHLIVNRFHDDAAQAAQFALTWPALHDLPPLGELSARFRAACLLCMLGLGVRRGFISMNEAEVDELVAQIPEEYFASNIWYYLIVWAYFASNINYLERALAEQTVHATGWVDDYYWQRTNMMYQLVTGKATRLDVEKTITGYQHPHHIQDFRNLFLRRCEAAGLMDPSLYALLERREAELKERTGTVPGLTAKTKRVVRQ